MKELKVGERVTITLEVVEHKECDGCFFDELCGDIYNVICKNFNCSASSRKDGKNVQFKRVK